MQIAEIEATSAPIQQYKTTSAYHMAYMIYKGFDVKLINRKAIVGKAEVTFEGPNAKQVAILYHNSPEKQLLDSYIKAKSLIHDDPQ